MEFEAWLKEAGVNDTVITNIRRQNAPAETDCSVCKRFPGSERFQGDDYKEYILCARCKPYHDDAAFYWLVENVTAADDINMRFQDVATVRATVKARLLSK